MQRDRRLTFGQVAELYDQARPSYPSELVDDSLEAAARRSGPLRALEIGAGTGKATVRFAARGVVIHALEPSERMAAVARRNCSDYPQVTFENTDFEHWVVQPAAFGLVYSAQAWHWVAPEVRYVLARQALTDGGALAVFWNRPLWEDSEMREDLSDAYRQAAPDFGPDPGPAHPAARFRADRWENWELEIEATPGFKRPEVRWYEWTCDYSAPEYVSLLSTHSDHIMLAPDRREALMEAVTEVIQRHGGTMSVRYVTKLCTARAA